MWLRIKTRFPRPSRLFSRWRVWLRTKTLNPYNPGSVQPVARAASTRVACHAVTWACALQEWKDLLNAHKAHIASLQHGLAAADAENASLRQQVTVLNPQNDLHAILQSLNSLKRVMK